MVFLKCKMCGGDMRVIDVTGICECEYCGSRQTVPKVDDEKRTNLFNRANRLRMNSEFDKAAGIYESIIADFAEESEAYWGLCLCKYGIEYVDDPKTGKKIPTCHRTSYTSIFKDQNYELALEYADEESSTVYHNEAKEIDRIQKSILEVASKETPYDIFICYKETDRNGNRTKDSVFGQEIYDALTDKGYKVFFSRISLEDKLGQEYEPYIFSALNSSRIMIAVGASYENYNSVWVKNEWSRFIDMMKQDSSKKLIPCYCDLDAYDLPEEFRNLQGQDMSKLGAIQDLVRGVEKILGTTSVREMVVIEKAENLEGLIKRGYICLSNKEWENADLFFDKALDIEPEKAEAYIGKLLAERCKNSVDDLKDGDRAIDTSSNYQNILRFGDAEIVNDFQILNDALKVKESEKKKHRQYVKACDDFKKAGTISEYEAIQRTFSSFGQYESSEEYVTQCSEEIEKIREINCKKAKRRKIAYIIGSIVAVIILLIIVTVLYIIPNKKYEEAIKLRDMGEYEEALISFSELDGFRDSESQIYEIKYIKGNSLFESGQYEEALNTFGEIIDYKDSAEQISKIKNAKLDSILKNAKKGDVISFGDYKGNSEWIVLERRTNEYLYVLSKYVVDYRKFNEDDYISGYSESDLRAWLNSVYYNEAFSTEEKERIMNWPTTYSFDIGNKQTIINVDEKVSIPIITDAEDLYSKYRIATLVDGTSAPWWIQNAKYSAVKNFKETKLAEDRTRGAYLDESGNIVKYFSRINMNVGVRPVMYIDIPGLE